MSHKSEDNFKKLFQGLHREIAPPFLVSRLQGYMQQREEKALWKLQFPGYVGLTISVAMFVFGIWYGTSEMSQTGFAQYVSLLFTDGGVTLSFWQDFLLILAESMPVVGLTTISVAVFILLVSIREIFTTVSNHTILTT